MNNAETNMYASEVEEDYCGGFEDFDYEPDRVVGSGYERASSFNQDYQKGHHLAAQDLRRGNCERGDDNEDSEEIGTVDTIATAGTAQVAQRMIGRRVFVSKPEGKPVKFNVTIPLQVPIGPNVLMLGELVVDLNLFCAWDEGSNRYGFDTDLPWNVFRPAQRIEQFNDGSMLSFHDTAIEGRLDFTDIVKYMYTIPNAKAHSFAEKLDKYQQKIIRTQEALTQLKEYYSAYDLATIFTEVQSRSLVRAQEELRKLNEEGGENLYLYGINTIHPTNLLQTPFAMGQSNGLVELLGGHNEAYKMQILRKGFLNFCSVNSHLQLLLVSTGVLSEAYLEQRTIEGLVIPFHITMEKRVLYSISLNPVHHKFNSILSVYRISVPPNVLANLREYRETHKFEGLPDDFSYMMACQVFLTKHYVDKYEYLNYKRCDYTILPTKASIEANVKNENQQMN